MAGKKRKFSLAKAYPQLDAHVRAYRRARAARNVQRVWRGTRMRLRSWRRLRAKGRAVNYKFNNWK